jgi:preprotein translocase subunit YajC
MSVSEHTAPSVDDRVIHAEGLAGRVTRIGHQDVTILWEDQRSDELSLQQFTAVFSWDEQRGWVV